MSALSPRPPQPQPQECGEDEAGEEGPDDGADAPLTDPPTPSYPSWTTSPSLNSNLRDLTPSHTLDQGLLCCPPSEAPLALGGDGTEGGIGGLHTPPQKKKVSLLEYRKRQREARRSGSNPECSSPVSTAPPLARLGSTALEDSPVAMETAPEPHAHTSRAASEAPHPSEVTETPPQGEREGGEGQWTSSTSVEEARERSYQRSLQFTDHHKDTDRGDAEGETGGLKKCSSPCRSPSALQPCSLDAGPVSEEDSAPCVLPSVQQPSVAPLTPTKAQCPPTAAAPGPYPGPSLLLPPHPQAPPTSPAAYTQYSFQSAPPPPPPPPAPAGSFPGQTQAPPGPYPGHFPPTSQTHHALHFQSSAPPPPPARLHGLAPPVLLGSAPPPPPPPPQSHAPQQQPSSACLLSLQQAPPPPPAPGPSHTAAPHFPGLGAFQTPAAPPSTFQAHQQGTLPPPPPPPPQQTPPTPTMRPHRYITW